MGTLYFYANGQRIAMKKDGVVSCIYGDQLGSVSAVADAGGNLISETLYHPWGTTRYAQGTSPTDYGYTGQMKEGDIYFYNARWYDPQLGRFMQADTIVPTAQGTQGFDRYAYVNNSPMRYTDPSGHCVFGIDTAVCITVGAMAVGALFDYGYQVYRNMQSGMEFKEALTPDISAEEIIGGAIYGGFAIVSGISFFTTATAYLGGMKLAETVCADGDCTNEIRALMESGYETVDDVADSELAQTIARTFTHNPSSSTVSLGSNPNYLQVGENMNYTYFNMSTRAWDTLGDPELPNIFWKGVNAAYMNQQMALSKEFVTAIFNPLRPGPGISLELDILRNSPGYMEIKHSLFHQICQIK